MERDCVWITYASCELEEAQNHLQGFCLTWWCLLGLPLRRGHPFRLKEEAASNFPVGRSSICCGLEDEARVNKGESGTGCKVQRRQGHDKSWYFTTNTMEAMESIKGRV